MNTRDAISARRSIRRFSDAPVDHEDLVAILEAARQAPSGKNRQPWRLVVVQDDQRDEMLARMAAGIEQARVRGDDRGSSPGTLRVMAQAPVTIFVLKPGGMPPWITRSVEQAFNDVVDIQSIGAAIQNLLLAATDLGLGSLWICDVFYAYDELMSWLGEEGQLIAAVSIGHPEESPSARPRKPLDEIATWYGVG
jgi:F420 biosynthesis protein FbiB-like protein